MSETKIARRYATALSENRSTKELDLLYNAMQEVQATLLENPELKQLLKNAVIESSEKSRVLLQVFKNQSDIMKNFLMLVCEKRRENILENIAEAFISLYYELNQRITVEVTSAHPLNPETEKAIIQMVKNQTQSQHIEIKSIIDDHIMGGFIVRYGDYLIDSSIKTQLNQIKKEFNIA